jgi:two-component system cell cycle sensor histidine kinase/response regulator CckA
MKGRYRLKSLWRPVAATLAADLPGSDDLPATLRVLLLSTLVATAGLVFVAVPFFSERKLGGLLLCASQGALVLAAMRLERRGRIRLASWVFLSGTWVVVTILVVLTGGFRSVVPVGYLAVTVAAGWLLGRRVALTAVGLSMAATLVMALCETFGYRLPRYLPARSLAGWVFLWFAVAITVVPVNQMLRTLAASLELSRRKIEDLRRTEEALREGEEKYRELFEIMSDAVFLIDNQEGWLLEANATAVNLYGYHRQALLGMKNTDLSAEPGETRSATVTGRTFVPVRWHRKIDGTVFPVEITARHFTRNGRPVHIAVIRDITARLKAEEERSRLEEQLRQSQRLESVGRLAGGVAHDFNNLLTVINGYADMTLGELAAEDPIRPVLEEIRNAGQRAASLTQQLLAFSRKQMIEPRPMDLNAVVAESEKMLKRLVGEDIEFSTSLSPLPCPVMVDSGQIHQILMNLAVNARDAMPAGGSLRVETAHLDLGEEQARGCPDAAPGRYVRLAVADSGTGMDEDTLRRIFEPFFTTKRQGAGTGLGLSVVYGIVRQSGGWIQVNSRPGSGTTFEIYLPRLDAASLDEVAHDAPATGLRGTESVLVVEDQEEVRRLAVEVLRRYGYSVLEAAHGPEALGLAERHTGTIDLMLTDVIMPGMTGRELAARLTPIRPEAKVLYMSGYSRDVIGREGVLENGMPYLAKPFTPEELARKVRELLGPPEEDDDPADGRA